MEAAIGEASKGILTRSMEEPLRGDSSSTGRSRVSRLPPPRYVPLPKLSEPVRYTSSLDAALPVLVQSVKEQGFEGLVAKRGESHYEPGVRSGSWQKMRINQGQEFVIG